MSPHNIAGSPDQSSLNSGNKCPLAKPLTVPNFIVLDQTMHEKSVTKYLHRSVFWRIRGPPGPKLTNLGTDVRQDPDYQSAKFRPLL